MLPHCTAAPLDPGFVPAVWFNRNYAASLRASGGGAPVVIALERENGLVSRFATVTRAAGTPTRCATLSAR